MGSFLSCVDVKYGHLFILALKGSLQGCCFFYLEPIFPSFCVYLTNVDRNYFNWSGIEQNVHIVTLWGNSLIVDTLKVLVFDTDRLGLL